MAGRWGHQSGDSVELLRSVSPHLWAISVTFFGVGDLVTTLVGLRLNGVGEVGPVAGLVAGEGPLAFGGLKLVVFLLCGLLWKLAPNQYAVGVPLGLATLGVLVTVWNMAVIFVMIA